MTMMTSEPSPVSLVPPASPAQPGHFARPKLLPYHHHNLHHRHSSHTKIIHQSSVNRQHSLPNESIGLTHRTNSFGQSGATVDVSPGKTVNLVILPSSNESSSSSTSSLTSSLPTASTSPASSHPWSEAGLFKSNIHLSHKLHSNHGSPPTMAVPQKSPISPNQSFYQHTSLIPPKIGPGDFTDSYSFPITHSSPYQANDYRATPFNLRSEVRVKDAVDWSHLFGNSTELTASTSSSLLSTSTSCISPLSNDSQLLVSKCNAGTNNPSNQTNNGNNEKAPKGDRPHLHALHKLRREIAKGLASSCRVIIRDTSKRSRPSLLSLGRDFFYRFHDREKFALTAFDFLDDYTSKNDDACDDGYIVPSDDFTRNRETHCNQMYLHLLSSTVNLYEDTSEGESVDNIHSPLSPSFFSPSPPPAPPSTPREAVAAAVSAGGHDSHCVEKIGHELQPLVTGALTVATVDQRAPSRQLDESISSETHTSSSHQGNARTFDVTTIDNAYEKSVDQSENSHTSSQQPIVPYLLSYDEESVNATRDENATSAAAAEAVQSYNLPSESTSDDDEGDTRANVSISSSDSSKSCDLSNAIMSYQPMEHLPDGVTQLADDLHCLLAEFDTGKESTDVTPLTDICFSQIEKSFQMESPACVPIYNSIDSSDGNINQVDTVQVDDTLNIATDKCHTYLCDLSPESDVDMTAFWKLVHLNSEMEESENDKQPQQQQQQQQQPPPPPTPVQQQQQSTGRKHKGKDKYSCNRGKSRRGKHRQRQRQRKNHVDVT